MEFTGNDRINRIYAFTLLAVGIGVGIYEYVYIFVWNLWDITAVVVLNLILFIFLFTGAYFLILTGKMERLIITEDAVKFYGGNKLLFYGMWNEIAEFGIMPAPSGNLYNFKWYISMYFKKNDGKHIAIQAGDLFTNEKDFKDATNFIISQLLKKGSAAIWDPFNIGGARNIMLKVGRNLDRGNCNEVLNSLPEKYAILKPLIASVVGTLIFLVFLYAYVIYKLALFMIFSAVSLIFSALLIYGARIISKYYVRNIQLETHSITLHLKSGECALNYEDIENILTSRSKRCMLVTIRTSNKTYTLCLNAADGIKLLKCWISSKDKENFSLHITF